MSGLVDRLVRQFLMSPKRFGQILGGLEKSEAHAKLCSRVYGRNLGQFNAASMLQLDALVGKLDLHSNATLFDIGCGTGLVTEYLAEKTGATAVGFDFASEAIRIASARTELKRSRIRFEFVDLNKGEIPKYCADAVIAIDSLYSVFLDDLANVVRKLSAALRPGL